MPGEVTLREYVEAVLEERLRAQEKDEKIVQARLDSLQFYDQRLTALENFRAKALGFGTLIALIAGMAGAIIRGMFG